MFPCVVFWDLPGASVVENAVDDFVLELLELGQFFLQISIVRR